MAVPSRVAMVAAFVAVASARAASATEVIAFGVFGVSGQSVTIKDPRAGAPGTESKRSVTTFMKTAANDGPAILGNPVTSGASLSVVTAAGSQCFSLPALGWSGGGSKGFKYKGSLVPGNPVVSASLKTTGINAFLQKTVLRGKSGPIGDLLQANSANVVFSIGGGGGTYCALWSGAILKNDQKAFKAVRSPGPTSCGASACPGVCGDYAANPGETCDTGGIDTASCDGDCTAPACGDGIHNTAAGEVCDTGADTLTCDAGDCSAVACGDGYANATAGEACDTGGGNTATCDSDCTAPVCGDGLVNAPAGEACDSGGPDTASCDGGDCTHAACGDGYINAAAGEQCDTGGVDSPSCDLDCTIPTCGDGHVNGAAGEVCDPSGAPFGSGPPLDNGVCDGCLSPSGAFLDETS